MKEPNLPDYSHVPMHDLSIESLNARLCSKCDVCGRPRSVLGGHRKCAKIRQQFYKGK